MKYIYKFFVTMVLVIAVTSCGDDILDINNSPNNPSTSTPQFTLPAAQVGIAARLGFDYNLLGSVLSQYWTQGPTASQYSFLETYTINTNNYTGAWSTMYATSLEDLEFVRLASLEEGSNNTAAVAMILKAYTFQVLVDLYDQVPYSEALKGKEGVLQPKFEAGDVVYDGLIIDLDAALALIDFGSSLRPGSEDLIYRGDLNLWVKFANTLKLKIFMRQSEARPSVAEAGIAQLYADGAEFISPGEDAVVNFSATTQNENPLWQNLNQTSFQNLVASKTSIDILSDIGDSRIQAFYDVAPNSGSFVGLAQGVGTSSGGVYNDFAHLSADNVVIQTAPVVFISSHESLFLQAEAVQRGWGTGDAKSLYDQAVTTSFASFGDDASTYIGVGNDYEFDGTLAQIYTQKWIAFNGSQGFEAWNEMRRTGVPSLGTSATTTLAPGQVPLRLVWPSNETAGNPKAPAILPITTPVWWDVN